VGHFGGVSAMRTIAALVVMLALLFPVERATAAETTLEHMKQNCEQLESYWRLDPPTADGSRIPNQAGAAICYGYILAFSDLRQLSGIVGIAANCYRTPQGNIVGGPNCRPALGICIPVGVLFSQHLAVFLAYARSHVAQWHEDAWHHYLSAMIAAFPCKDENAAPLPN
jgi:hypothetical protein